MLSCLLSTSMPCGPHLIGFASFTVHSCSSSIICCSPWLIHRARQRHMTPWRAHCHCCTESSQSAFSDYLVTDRRKSSLSSRNSDIGFVKLQLIPPNIHAFQLIKQRTYRLMSSIELSGKNWTMGINVKAVQCNILNFKRNNIWIMHGVAGNSKKILTDVMSL